MSRDTTRRKSMEENLGTESLLCHETRHDGKAFWKMLKLSQFLSRNTSRRESMLKNVGTESV